MAPRSPSRPVLVDGGLAAVGLLAVLAVAAALDVPPDPLVAGLGGAGAVGLEALLERRHGAVRRVWAHARVKLLTGVAFLALVAATVLVAPSRGLSALAGGLLAYLGLLAGRTVGRALAGRG